MAQANFAERLARLQDELRRCRPSKLRTEEDAHTLQPKTKEDANALLDEIKQNRLMYLAVENQLCLARHSCHSDANIQEELATGREYERTRIQSMKELRELKREVDRGFGAIQELHGETSRLLAELLEEHNTVARTATEVQKLYDELKDEDGIEDMQDGFEVSCLSRALKAVDANREELEQLERNEAEKLKKLEKLDALEVELGLGLPKFIFDDERGTITLESRGNSELNEGGIALRTVAVSYDEHGRLKHAEPHPSLELSRESVMFVEKDDLAGLLAIVWEKVCSKVEQQSCGSQTLGSQETPTSSPVIENTRTTNVGRKTKVSRR